LTRNTAIDHHRRESGNRLSLAGHDEREEAATEVDPTLALENAEAVHEALGRLSQPHREVLTLFFLQDLTIDQIAEVIGVKGGTVKSRLHYARAALRKVLEDEGQP
jgi:RNA polymerase sigma-70 factor (ECF subfamily)